MRQSAQEKQKHGAVFYIAESRFTLRIDPFLKPSSSSFVPLKSNFANASIFASKTCRLGTSFPW